jgi:hypothetical protein
VEFEENKVGGSNGLPQSQNTNKRSSSVLQHLDHGRQIATPSLNSQQQQQLLKQQTLVTSSPNNNEVPLTQSPAPSNHTPPGSVGQAHVSPAGQLVSTAAFRRKINLFAQLISMLMSAYFNSETIGWISNEFDISDLHFKLSKLSSGQCQLLLYSYFKSLSAVSLKYPILHNWCIT